MEKDRPTGGEPRDAAARFLGGHGDWAAAGRYDGCGGFGEGGRSAGGCMNVAGMGARLFAAPAVAVPLISWPGGSPENTGIIVAVILGAYLAALWLTAIVWTARDIRARSTDAVTQLVAVAMVAALNLPGWVLYRVLRPPITLAELYERQLEEEALLSDLSGQLACPTCRAAIDDDYVACPHCATSLKEGCAGCGRALSFAWRACPWCARERSGARASSLPPARGGTETRPAGSSRMAGEGPAPRPIEPLAGPSAVAGRRAPGGSPFRRPGVGGGPGRAGAVPGASDAAARRAVAE